MIQLIFRLTTTNVAGEISTQVHSNLSNDGLMKLALASQAEMRRDLTEITPTLFEDKEGTQYQLELYYETPIPIGDWKKLKISKYRHKL